MKAYLITDQFKNIKVQTGIFALALMLLIEVHISKEW